MRKYEGLGLILQHLKEKQKSRWERFFKISNSAVIVEFQNIINLSN